MRESLLLSVAAALSVAFIPGLRAQEPVPIAKPAGVQITFLPPPIEGTVSLGVYNKAGKLVRVLKREAEPEKEFTVGLNGLITTWDGRDDAGKPVASGAYAVRGYCVGAIEVSGEAFHCNDWITTENALRVRTIRDLKLSADDRLLISAELANGKATVASCGMDGELRETADAGFPRDPAADALIASLPAGKIAVRGGTLAAAAKDADVAADLHQPLHIATGKDGTLWVIDKSAAAVEVQQYSASGEFLRRLSVPSGEPVPVKIAASAKSDVVFLLERSAGIERVRGLALESLNAPLPQADKDSAEKGPRSSTWRIVFSKTIRDSSSFANIADQLGRPGRIKPDSKLQVKLTPNPLFQDAATSVAVSIECDKEGSFLQAADGLPLCQVSDTHDLKWAVLARDAKGVSLFQSDSAAVEEYRVGKLTNMMAFDAGEYEWK